MSAMDLLKDLVSDGTWKDLYDREVARGNRFFERLSDAQCKLTICESQRSALIARVRMVCILLETNHPKMAELLRQQLDILEIDYARPLPPLRPSGETSGATPQRPTDQTGSGAVSEAATQLEAPQRIPVSHCPAGAYAGEWDEVKP